MRGGLILRLLFGAAVLGVVADEVVGKLLDGVLGSGSSEEKSDGNKKKGSSSNGTTKKKDKSSGLGGMLRSIGVMGDSGMLSSLSNVTVIRLRKGQDVSQLEEVACVETQFMSPYHVDVTFALNNSFVRQRHNSTCQWSFIGTEPCIPKLTCEEFKDVKCDEEFLEVYDGSRGLKQFCGDDKPLGVVASDDLRDLYIKYQRKVKKGPADAAAGDAAKFKCTVSCSKRGEGKPLPPTFTPTINPLCTCGGRPKKDRIVNGENAIPNEFPWLVAMVDARTRQPFCGGSLINDRVVLTAGHCFKGSYLDVRNFEILVGAHKLDPTPNTANAKSKPPPRKYDNETLERLDRENGTIRLIPEEYFVHPLYIPETNDYDVGAILLSEPFKFAGTKINPVCLPELGSYPRTFGHKKATVSGWGLQNLSAEGTPTVLQKVNVTVFTPKECKEMYAHRVNRRMLCAGYREGGRDSCSGDSGGPLVTEDRKDVWVQVGSVSWGDGCAGFLSPGVYFRTTESGQWLNYHSNVHGAVWCGVP